MTTIHPFSNGVIESLAKALGESASGSEITAALKQCAIEDNSGESTKWRRLHAIFSKQQQRDQSANSILQFVRTLLEPARFIGRNEKFEFYRQSVNTGLSFQGFELQPDGNIRRRSPVTTIPEAERRANAIRAKLHGRGIHHQAMKYCQAEFMHENYFHAVFEATKGLAQRIRDESGIEADGAILIDRVFAINHPIIAFNALQTETELSEHIGFATLLKGCFAAVRNPLAHQPKILWKGEDDAADYFTLISLLHRKLDDSFKTPFNTDQ